MLIYAFFCKIYYFLIIAVNLLFQECFQRLLNSFQLQLIFIILIIQIIMIQKSSEQIQQAQIHSNIVFNQNQQQTLQTKLNASRKNQKKQYEQSSDKLTTGHWTNDQNIKYVVFVSSNKKMFQQNQNRKVWKIYKMMEAFIGTRNIYQCRNHHQKMVQKYFSIENIIQEMENSFPSKIIRKVAKQYAQAHSKDMDQFIPKRTSKTIRKAHLKHKKKSEKLSGNKESSVHEEKESKESVSDIERKEEHCHVTHQNVETERNCFLEALLYYQQMQRYSYYQYLQC